MKRQEVGGDWEQLVKVLCLVGLSFHVDANLSNLVVVISEFWLRLSAAFHLRPTECTTSG